MKKLENAKPFEHAIYKNFLSETDLDKISKIYHKLKFKENKSDLYSFLQSSELNNMKELKFFKKELNKIYSKYYNLENTYYNIFGSYYKAGDYLICHDDLVENRIYAFTYYLEDFKSGELILYENDCVSENKRIKVRKNKLIIFKVGSTSFHEVAECTGDGRKAISGWLCSSYYKKPLEKKFKGNLLANNIELIKTDIRISEKDVLILETGDIEVKEICRKIVGPFNTRRFYNLEAEKYIGLLIDKFEVIYCRWIYFNSDSYILMNDEEINKCRDGFDIFICLKSDRKDSLLISYCNELGIIESQLEIYSNNVFIRARCDQYMLILKQKSEFNFIHFIYKAIV